MPTSNPQASSTPVLFSQASHVAYIGLSNSLSQQHYQLSPAQLIEQALLKGEGQLASNGALVVNTGQYTGRSPEDRFIVDETGDIHSHVDWGKVNRPISPNVFEKVYTKIKDYLSATEVYVHDGFAGAHPKHRLAVRFITQWAAHSLFVNQLFIRPTPQQLKAFKPQFTVLCAPGLKLNPQTDGVHSEAAVLIDMERKLVLVAATAYAGEMKKAIFSVMNYLMPDEEVLPMHCSANMGADGKTALFFGLSGTGKTTLSADPERQLIGDDEHGWADDGIFNFEGGCYAKTIRLSQKNEPQIWNAIAFGALAENVVLDPQTRTPNYDDDSLTENGRVGYPIESIPNAVLSGQGPVPSTLVFLTADAFGVLPPIAKLSPQQAQYHFISGYTSKVAGTERGITEPQAAFSACFGAPFMPRPVAVYANLLMQRIQQSGASVYLVNTGWQGGPYGVGQRISIPHTRAMISAALNGELDKVTYEKHPVFNLQMPTTCPGVPDSLLNPKAQWKDPVAYDKAAHHLARLFVDHFKTFKDVEHLTQEGPLL